MRAARSLQACGTGGDDEGFRSVVRPRPQFSDRDRPRDRRVVCGAEHHQWGHLQCPSECAPRPWTPSRPDRADLSCGPAMGPEVPLGSSDRALSTAVNRPEPLALHRPDRRTDLGRLLRPGRCNRSDQLRTTHGPLHGGRIRSLDGGYCLRRSCCRKPVRALSRLGQCCSGGWGLSRFRDRLGSFPGACRASRLGSGHDRHGGSARAARIALHPVACDHTGRREVS